MSQSNGENYQMIKPWAPRSYNRCLWQPPPISRQTAVHPMAFCRTRLNMLASTIVTAAWSLATRSSIILEGTAQTCSFGCAYRRESIGVTFGEPGGHAIGPPPPHVQSTFLDMSRSTTDGHLPHSALELRRAGTTNCLTARDTPSSSLAE
jgi:hypothetical protein